MQLCRGPQRLVCGGHSLVILSPLDYTKRVVELHIPDPESDSKVMRYLG